MIAPFTVPGARVIFCPANGARYVPVRTGEPFDRVTPVPRTLNRTWSAVIPPVVLIWPLLTAMLPSTLMTT